MNQNYSKQNTLLKSVRAILIGDTAVLATEVREIKYYVSNRIVQGQNPVSLLMPQVTMDVNDGMNEQLLPSGEYYLMIKCWVEQDSEAPNDTLNNLSTRIIYLLNNRYNELNTKFPSENLRCRFIVKQSNTKHVDAVAKIIDRTILFRVIADDEILVLNN